MVLFFIADLALTLAFKLGAWCLGKTCDSIAYLVTTTKTTKTTNHKPESNEHEPAQLILDDDYVIIKRCEYEALKRLHNSHHLSESESESESESLVVESSSLPPSK
jgi:hypothetical protein